MNTPEWLEAIKQRLKDIPPGLRSDWEHTNHYELTKPDGEWMWFAMDEIAPNFNQNIYSFLPDTEPGKRLGYIFDAAAAVPALLQLVEKQREALEKARHDLVTSNNLLATDRPDLVSWPENLCWMTNQKAGIKAIDEALNFKPEGVEA